VNDSTACHVNTNVKQLESITQHPTKTVGCVFFLTVSPNTAFC